MTRVKPLFYYAGGKVKLLKTYYRFFKRLRPEHCVDYFGGSGTVSLWFHQLYPQAKLYLNDIDPAIYDLFQCIHEDYDHFCTNMEFLEEYINQDWIGIEQKKDLYYKIRWQYNIFDQLPQTHWTEVPDCNDEGMDEAAEHWVCGNLLEDASGKHACYLFLRKLSFSGMNQRNRQGEYITGAGIRPATQSYCHPEALADFKAMLEHAALFNKDYRELDFHLPQSLHYFDPPYLGSAKNTYTSQFGWDETAELCEYVQRIAEHSTVFMSNYDHPQLKKLMKGFNWYTFPSVGGMHNKRKKEPVREILFYKIHPSITG